MATATSATMYGLYICAKRYVMPLVSPPTPPQLEQDKAAIDAEFSKAFALLETLSEDTAALKAAEQERTERLDKSLTDVEGTIAELKIASKRREEENRRISDGVRGLQDDIARAIDNSNGERDKRLKELGGELKSLKLLLVNRLGGQAQADIQGSSTQNPEPAKTEGLPDTTQNGPTSAPSSLAHSTPNTSVQSSSTSMPRRDGPLSNFGSGSGRAASIPAWQMAAANTNSNRPKSASPNEEAKAS
ncbi:MAG: hypothetical protein Q9227_006922 [Pyrenula ochraceoflavens]